MTGKKKGIFYEPPHFKKYAEIVRIDTPQNARKSVKILLKEAKSAKTRAKIRRILRVAVLAANRAAASRKRKNLSARERRELKQVERIYRDAAKKLSELLKKR